jgi:hypothetical protein
MNKNRSKKDKKIEFYFFSRTAVEMFHQFIDSNEYKQ